MKRWGMLLAALLVLGIVLAAIGGTTLEAIGLGLVGVVAVGAVSLGFFAVGRSEDVARAEEEAQRPPRPAEPQSGDGRLTSRRPPRSRGDS